MAITRTQIAKQLLEKGGRVGLFKGAEADAREGRGDISPGTDRGGNVRGGGDGPDRRSTYLSNQYTKPTNVTKKEFEDRLNRARDFRDTQTVKKAFTTKTLFDKIPSSLKLLSRAIPGNLQYRLDFLKNRPELLEYFNSLTEEEQKSSKLMSALDEIGYGDFLAEEKGAPGLMKAGNVGGLEKFVKEDGTFGYTDVGNRDGADNILLPQGIMAQAPSSTDKEDDDKIINYRLLNKGGRVGLFKGAQADASAGKGAMSPGTDTGGGFRGGNGDGPKGPPTNVGGDGTTKLKSKFDTGEGLFSKSTPKINMKDIFFGLVPTEEQKNMKVAELFGEQKLKDIGAIEEGFFGNKLTDKGKVLEAFRNKATNFKKSTQNTANTPQAALDFMTNRPGVYGDIIENKDFVQDAINQGFLGDSSDYENQKSLTTFSTGGRAGLAGGGMPYEGGIMDLESARQMYGLGKLVKKVTRSVKKIAKSPIGKAAIGAALFKFGPAIFGKGSFNPFMAKGKFSGLGSILNKAGLVSGTGGLTGLGKLAGGAALTLAPFLFGNKEEEEQPLYAGADIADPTYIMKNPELFTNRRLVAEGGSMKEPVAKKTMPLLDMDGQEMDFRAEGGFVPIGRMEKADDVPARLSKNEFVFTADAVRNAGDGSVDKGAEVMYNMMKNLESGGDVSEESQGLDGARKMFQTSQRLEEVL